ncbi:MAG: hypothetical protein ACRD8A_04100 [Candidatus Acidiferrales bacterium]
MLCPAPSLNAAVELEKYAYVFTVVLRFNTHAVLTVTAGLPVVTPFETSAKFTSPGDAVTEIASGILADKFTPAMFDRTCAAVDSPQARIVANRIQSAHPRWLWPSDFRWPRISVGPNDLPDLDEGIMLSCLVICFELAVAGNQNEAANLPPRPARVVSDFARITRPRPWD